jgi:hypothetical protein
MFTVCSQCHLFNARFHLFSSSVTCSMPSVICSVPVSLVQCPMSFIQFQCHLFKARCLLFSSSVTCSMPSVICSMPSVMCSVPSVTCIDYNVCITSCQKVCLVCSYFVLHFLTADNSVTLVLYCLPTITFIVLHVVYSKSVLCVVCSDIHNACVFTAVPCVMYTAVWCGQCLW